MISFAAAGTWASRLLPVRATLTEEISRCYRLTLDLFAADSRLDPEDALNQRANVTLEVEGKRGPTRRKISGVVTEMALAGILPAGEVWYRLVLVPRLQLLDFTRRSRVFCTEKPAPVAAVIGDVMNSAEGASLTPTDMVMRLQSSAYPELDMVVQYHESDLAFLSRIAENSGIFYFFVEGESGERVVFTDANAGLPWLGGDQSESTLSYRPSVGIADPGPAVRSTRFEAHLVNKSVALNQRFYAQPERVLSVAATAAPNGVGLLAADERDGYRDASWGQALADIRAQAAAAKRVVLTGSTDCVTLAAGAVFSLAQHANANLNGPYIIVSVEHSVWESAKGIEYLPGPGPQGAGYRNHFTAIPSATPFRPERRTPWPRIPGLIRAVIDGPDVKRSNVEPLGCYRIKFPFDRVTRAPGKSSCAVRLITPYGGPAEGFHFPLRVNTQVMVAFRDGDPDRPVIVGPLYDAAQQSVVTDRNRTANVISTVTGITITMNDGTA